MRETGVGSNSRSASSHPAPARKAGTVCHTGSGSGIPAPTALVTSNCVPVPEATGPIALMPPPTSPSPVSTRVSAKAPRCAPAYDPTSSPTAPARAGTPMRLTDVRRLPGRSLMPASIAAIAATTPREARPASSAASSSGPAARAPRVTAAQGTGPRWARRACASQGGRVSVAAVAAAVAAGPGAGVVPAVGRAVRDTGRGAPVVGARAGVSLRATVAGRDAFQRTVGVRGAGYVRVSAV
ncbi:hypothetical protein GCM10010385_33940 [Streptomyces geysiriensis]|nr:hypothetical protein GCM10010385_33940 [Streptomyces geysiriensis]